ncbi:MAG: hypothetical protein ACKVXR_17095 [Planctomycetota bacterium]
MDWYDDYLLGTPPFGPPIDGVRREITSLYAAWGATEDLDLIFSAAYVSATADDASGLDSEQDLQDALAYAKWKVLERELGPGQFRLLLSPGIEFPLTDYATYEDNALNGLGDQAVVLRARLIAHYQAGAAFASVETGYDHVTGELDDELPFHATVGMGLGRGWTLSSFYTKVAGIGDTFVTSPAQTEIDEYQRYGLAAYFQISDTLGLTANVRRSDEGRNESEGLSLGLVFRF